ncbi:MAG: hypothetical protein HUU46_06915 [Candidatus Hydrogenedentes bacterium]|nr:hypothetical protein [Candidatus Hydrogenedentota bacterium]
MRVSPIQRALLYLDAAQTKRDSMTPGEIDYRGNWPQIFHFRNVPGYRIKDVSPFVVVFAHHALAGISPATQDALGLGADDIKLAHKMRVRAVDCLNRFKADDAAFDAETFGFWPYEMDSGSSTPLLEDLLFDLLEGPVLGGTRAPVNLSYFPTEMAVPTDADVTATVYAALLDHRTLDGGEAVTANLDDLFGGNRHIDAVPLRFDPAWLPDDSGAFLTWFMENASATPQYGNDIDLVVNANVLFALARFGLVKTPGFSESVAVIDDAVRNGLHRVQWDNISLYYPDSYVFHYCVSRAYAEGPIPELDAAVQQLASEIIDEARTCADGTSYWDKGSPELNTAFAVLSLIHSGVDTPLIDEGIAFLERRQNSITGAWGAAPFFIARADSGIVIEWESAPLTTAIALEALCKAKLRARR